MRFRNQRRATFAAIDDKNPAPVSREVNRRAQAAGPTADDQNVEIFPFKRGHATGLLVFNAKRRAIAGVSSRHADMHLVSLTQCQGSRSHSGFKCRLLAGVLVGSRSIMKHTPAVSFRYDPVFSYAHVSLRSN